MMGFIDAMGLASMPELTSERDRAIEKVVSLITLSLYRAGVWVEEPVYRRARRGKSLVPVL